MLGQLMFVLARGTHNTMHLAKKRGHVDDNGIVRPTDTDYADASQPTLNELQAWMENH